MQEFTIWEDPTEVASLLSMTMNLRGGRVDAKKRVVSRKRGYASATREGEREGDQGTPAQGGRDHGAQSTNTRGLLKSFR